MTGIKIVDGIYSDGKRIEAKKLTVRVTKTFEGESLGITDEEKGIMFYVPVEPIQKNAKEKLMDSKYELIKNSWRQEMRYKVGDKVRIKDDISACKYTNKQVDIMIEEMSELTKALIKHRREPSDETLENIQEEIADVKIMMCQGAMMFGEEAVERFVHEKTERLRKRVEEKLEAANKKKKFRLEDYRGGYAMHCDTEKKAETFLKFLHRSGKNWRSGSSYLKSTHWGGFENEACYRFNEGTIGRLEFAKSEGYDILEFDDFYWGDVNE